MDLEKELNKEIKKIKKAIGRAYFYRRLALMEDYRKKVELTQSDTDISEEKKTISIEEALKLLQEKEASFSTVKLNLLSELNELKQT